MQKFFCAIGFLSLVLIFQDCLVPVESVRVRVVKVKRQDSHYAKRQVSRNPYTDVPLAGDPDAESFPVNTNNLRPDENPYNAGNRPADYPLNNNIPYDDQNRGTSTASNNPDRYYPGSNNNNNNNNYGDRQPSSTGQQQQGGGGIIPSSSPQKAKEKGEDCPGCGHSIPGEAGVDYPNYNSPPKTSFSCSNQQWSGYYADTEARCQVFWICQKNRADAFLCPNGTIFNQQVFVCDWWFNSDCNTAADYYSRNQYLYAGPTVDLFGNTIIPYTGPTAGPGQQRPVRLEVAPAADSEQSPSRPAVVTPQKRPAPQVVAKQPARQVVTQAPIRRQQPAPQRQQPAPQQTPIRQQPQRQTVTQTNVAPSGGYGSSTSGYTTQVSNRRNDDYPAPTNPPTYIRTAQQQQKPTDYRNDRLKQGQNTYPVPGNSLAAVDGDFGLKMNNIKAAVEFAEPARQTQYDRAEEERRYKNNNNNNNIDRAEQERQAGKNKPINRNPGNNNNNYPVSNQAGGYPSNNNNQGGYSSSNSNRGGYSNNNQGYTSTAVSGGYSSSSGGYSTSSSANAAYTAQTETPIIRRVGNAAAEQLPRQPLYSSGSKQFEPVIGYGQKLRSNLKSVAPVSDYVVDQQEAGSFSSEVPSVAQLYSSTTKRNALDDYDSENTTPYTLSHDDEDLVATVSTFRYGETAAVAAKPSVYSTEVEVPVNSGSSETTTTPAPLTFGQKLTRAARKRNTSNWGNWRTMLLGDF